MHQPVVVRELTAEPPVLAVDHAKRAVVEVPHGATRGRFLEPCAVGVGLAVIGEAARRDQAVRALVDEPILHLIH